MSFMGVIRGSLVILLLLAGAPGLLAAPGQISFACTPTVEQENGPFYRPDAPVRESVGSGYLMRGTVRSAATCRPLPGARLEFWLAGPEGYSDRYRATQFAASNGTYSFSGPFPKNYGGRSHIHIRVTAPGYNELYTQHYPKSGTDRGSFDLVLVPVDGQ